MVWTKDSDRVAINQHLHRFHNGYAASGSTENRIIAHELLHAEGENGVAGNPPHTHASAGIEGLRAQFVNPA